MDPRRLPTGQAASPSHRAPRSLRRRMLPIAVALAACVGGATAIAASASPGGRAAASTGATVEAGSTPSASSLPVADPSTGQPTPSPPPPAPAPASASASASASGTGTASAKPAPAGAGSASAASRSTAARAGGGSSSGAATGSDAVQQVLDQINKARAGQGLAPLALTTGLDSSSAKHNTTMAGGCGLSHQCSGEPALGSRETAEGVKWGAAGENIGEGGPVGDSSSAVAGMAVDLTQSMLAEKPPNDGHRRNILSASFTHVGIAVLRDSAGTVWLTQDFSD